MIFGVHTGLQGTTTQEVTDLWRRVEDMGFAFISIWDHFYSADATGDPNCLEAVSMHTALALTTSRVRCGSLVYSVGYRHPAVLAKAIATIDNLSGGRAELGLGAGWFVGEYRAFGMPFGPPRERLDMLEEAIQCVRALLRGETVTFRGGHFTMDNARCEPRPVQDTLPLWVGGTGEKRTAKIAARWADWWNVPYVSPEDLARKRDVLHRHCERADRDAAQVRLAVNVGLAWREEDLRKQFGVTADFVRPGCLLGSVEEVRDKIGRYADAGAEQLNVVLRAPWDVEGLERLATALF